MAEHARAVVHETSHPSSWGYVKVFLILFAFTALEVSALYVPALHSVLPFILITFSALKFATVAMFYMHLRFDNWLFTAFFVGGIAIAISLVLALMTLFGTWWQVPITHGGPNVEHSPQSPSH